MIGSFDIHILDPNFMTWSKYLFSLKWWQDFLVCCGFEVNFCFWCCMSKSLWSKVMYFSEIRSTEPSDDLDVRSLTHARALALGSSCQISSKTWWRGILGRTIPLKIWGESSESLHNFQSVPKQTRDVDGVEIFLPVEGLKLEWKRFSIILTQWIP